MHTQGCNLVSIRRSRMHRALWASPIEDRHVAAAWDGYHQRLLYALRRVIKVNTLPQFGGIDPDDIVLAAVIVWGATEYLRADLLLMNFGSRILNPLAAYVKQKVAESR